VHSRINSIEDRMQVVHPGITSSKTTGQHNEEIRDHKCIYISIIHCTFDELLLVGVQAFKYFLSFL